MPRPRNPLIERKITVKEVTGGPAKWFAAFMEFQKHSPGQVFPLMTVYGTATRAVPDTSDYGEFVKFHGQFRSIDKVPVDPQTGSYDADAASGEVRNSGILLLPSFIEAGLDGALAGAQSVQFAFDIGVVYDATVATKYKYVVSSLLPVGENDPLAGIEQAIGLTAPATVAEIGHSVPRYSPGRDSDPHGREAEPRKRKTAQKALDLL